MYLGGFGKIFGDFCLKIFFPLLKKKIVPKNHFFWQFLKNTIFSQKSDYLKLLILMI